MDDLTSRFLSAFNIIHDWMKHSFGKEDVDFVILLNQLDRSNSEVRRHSAELKRFAKLRNLIAHNHSHTQPLAVPTALSVERLETISKQLLSPPLLFTLAAKPVESCQPTDPLGICVKKMHDGAFSQLPIYDGQRYWGLLTAETIARWLASFFVGDGQGIVDEQSVAEVMRHQEDGDNVEFMARTATVANALAAFDKFLHNGHRLEAILITNSGSRSEALLGIVTINDIPKLNKAING